MRTMRTDLSVHDVIAFLLEAFALLFWALLAWSLPDGGVLRWVTMGLACGVFILLWALFFAPKAKHRIPMPWRMAAQVPMLLVPGLSYLRTTPLLLVIWAVLVLSHIGLSADRWEE